MPKSKHRKNQKKKAKQRTERLKGEKKIQMKQIMEMMDKKQTDDKDYDSTPITNMYDLGYSE